METREPLLPQEWTLLRTHFERTFEYGLDGVVGMLTAVHSSPTNVAIERWLPLLIPDNVSLAADEDSLVGLLLTRLYFLIGDRLEAGVPIVPAIDDVEGVKRWCEGYMMGIDLGSEAWGDLAKLECIEPIGLLAGDFELRSGRGGSGRAEKERIFAAAREEIAHVALEVRSEMSSRVRRLAEAEVRQALEVARERARTARTRKKSKTKGR